LWGRRRTTIRDTCGMNIDLIWKEKEEEEEKENKLGYGLGRSNKYFLLEDA